MRRSLITLGAFLTLGLLLGACSKEHGELLSSFPLPLISEAKLASAESVQLTWSVDDPIGVEEYRIYAGIYANLGFSELDTMSLAGTATGTSYLFEDEDLDEVNPWIGNDGENDIYLCDDFGLCDSLYRYTYFRVSAVRGGLEGQPGPRVFPSW